MKTDSAVGQYPLLDQISSPEDLRRLERSALAPLAEELRAFLLASVSETGGHLSSNLGTVELTVALHYAYNTPYDRLVWDVGHQTYVHKILTGRRAGMEKLRMKDGISGFPKRSESAYDIFGTGHSSTSISAALGMAVAAKKNNEQRHAVAVIGDGAMSAGMAFEGLNNAGDQDVDLLVILNDNDMSISPPVGALNKYLSRLLTSRAYNLAKRGTEKMLGKAPSLLELARRTEEHAKGMVMPGTMFEEFGFNYIGPVNGHDLDELIEMLEAVKMLKGPQFLHVITQKGQGYKLAEADPVLYHGVSRFMPNEGISTGNKKPSKLSYTQVFGDWLCDMAARDERLIAITPAMREGSGLTRFSEEFAERYYDAGIAEQHAVTFAAGLACEGLKPVVAIYSTFLQRAYDQLIHDVALQNLPVLFAIDRGGLVGADGATHHGVFDLSYLICIPNMVVMVPANEAECRKMLSTAFMLDVPTAVRYPRGGSGMDKMPEDTSLEVLNVGESVDVRQGKRIAILAFGSMLGVALEAGEALDATVVNMRFVKPIDAKRIIELAGQNDLLVSIEENAIIGGAGAEVARVLEVNRLATPILRLGLPDYFIHQGEQSQLLAQVGLDTQGVIRAINDALLH